MSGPSGATTERGAGIFAPLAHATFRGIWISSTVSNTGSLIQSVAAAWVMAEISTADDVALVQTASFLPMALLALPAGAIADIYDRRRVQITFLTLSLLSALALAIVSKLGLITPWLLLALCFLVGSGGALSAPARGASVGEQVPKELLPQAVGLNNISYNLARSLGPAIGGVIVAAVGAAAAFILNAVSYLGILGTLAWWRPARVRSELPPEPLGTAMAAGVRYISLSPHLLSIMVRCVLFTIPIAAVPALMPTVARDLLGGGATTYGVLLGGFGIGAMLGALSSATLRTQFTHDRLLRLLSALACAAMIGIGTSRWMALTLAAHVLAGTAWTLAFANFNIAVQLSSPRWVTGRMLAIYQSIAFAGIALGSWWWGRFGTAIGLREALVVAGLSALIALVAARWLPIAVEQLGSLDPRARGSLNPPSVDIHPTSGPIVVVIEYRVPAEHAVEFVAVINDVGRIRRRDGARAWSICQDIDTPERWIERFESPTWLDHLRWRTRPTESDQAVRARLVRLIVGEHGTVRRFVERPPGADPLGSPTSAADRNVTDAGHGPHGRV